MEPCEIPRPTQVFTMDSYRGFALQKPPRVRHAVLRWNTQTQVNMVRQRMSLHQFYSRLVAQFPEDLPYTLSQTSEHLLLSVFWTEHNVYLQYHFTCDWLFHSRMSISFFELPGSLKGDRLSHAATAEPLRVAPPEAVVYLF